MLLKIDHVSKTYGKDRKKALDEFTAELSAGVYALLGPNGAGKSTLMNIITDNLRQDSGSVLYDGENTAAMGKRFRQILGFMPQQQGVYDDFTAARFLWYMASLKGLNRTEAKQRIPELLEQMNLSDAANKKLGSFSGGMKQRILIAQALLNNPQVLILDEPTAGLDPKERIRIRNLISEIAFDKIVIFATHVVSDIEYIAKEILMLKQGRLIFKGPIDELLLSISGKVFETVVPREQAEKLQTSYCVSGISSLAGGIKVRFLSEEPPKLPDCHSAEPTLEDVYLYHFNE